MEKKDNIVISNFREFLSLNAELAMNQMRYAIEYSVAIARGFEEFRSIKFS